MKLKSPLEVFFKINKLQKKLFQIFFFFQKGENPEHEITGSYKLHDINESPDLDYEVLLFRQYILNFIF